MRSPRLDLQLLHQFTVSTAATLAPEGEVRDLWRVLIPQIGFSTDYILDGILAFSALHMARYDTKRRDLLLSHATQYHAASLEKALPLISSITPQNCNDLFLFGVLTLYFNLAKPIQTDDILLVGNGIVPEWLYLLRGIDSLVYAELDVILTSPVSLIFRATQDGACFWREHTPEEHDALKLLRERIQTRTQEDEARRKTLLEAVAALNRSYTFLFHPETRFGPLERIRGFYMWLFEIKDEFLRLLKVSDSEALCVLGYYSVLLKDLDRYWWIEGWAVHLVRRIYLLLDAEHKLWLRWAIEEVGWVPESMDI